MSKRQLWGEAVIEYPSGDNAILFTTHQSDIYSSIYSLIFIIFFILSFKYIRRSLIPIIHCCFRFSHTIKTQDNILLEHDRSALFVFSLFHFSMVAFFFLQVYMADFYHTYGSIIVPLLFLAFILFYGVKWALFLFIGWVVRHSGALAFLAKGSRDFIILSAIFTLPFPLFCLFSFSSEMTLLIIWCITIVVISYLLYLFRTLLHFIYARFSVFFWILYLCTLEIAPLALLYSVLKTI